MPRIKHYTQLIVFDSLAAICMIGALLTGWLPGPGGIPLFLVGLSFLAINHEWAKRYLELLRDYAERLGDLIFLPRLRLAFDILAPSIVVMGVLVIIYQNAWWMLSIGVLAIVLGLTLFLGNRNRWATIKRKFLSKR